MFVSYSTSNLNTSRNTSLNTSRNTSLNTSLNTSRHPQVPKISKYQISSKYVKVRSLWTSDMTGLHRLLDLSSFGIVLRVQSRTLLGFQALQFHLQIRADALVLDENARTGRPPTGKSTSTNHIQSPPSLRKHPLHIAKARPSSPFHPIVLQEPRDAISLASSRHLAQDTVQLLLHLHRSESNPTEITGLDKCWRHKMD